MSLEYYQSLKHQNMGTTEMDMQRAMDRMMNQRRVLQIPPRSNWWLDPSIAVMLDRRSRVRK